MPVKSQHPDYTTMLNKWQRCNDVAAGQEQIHAAGQSYLPALLDQTPGEYASYLTRTPFYNATWRTIVGLQGMLFRKAPKVDAPDNIMEMLENVTMTGKPLHIFALELSEECLKLGRVGVFVDYPIVDSLTTKADALLQNHRPLLKMYRATEIINWKTRNIKNATILSLVVLREPRLIKKDEYTDNVDVQYRVLDLFDEVDPLTGVVTTSYRVRVIIIAKDKDGKEIEVELSRSFPMINHERLEYIPFQFIGVDDVSWEIDEPPLIDLVDINLSHFRVSADYEHGCHFTGLPTPVVSGYQVDPENKTKFNIGSMTAWVFPNAQAKATYLEFTGQGLQALEKNLAGKEGQMAILGARMLEVSVRGVEAADTAAIHRGGEQSMLSSVAQAISIGLTKALKVFASFAGVVEKEIDFELNRDFFPVPMDALTVTAIIAGWQNSAYSYETMFENLQRGEIISLKKTAEEEQAAIKANPPPIPEAATASPKAASTAASGTGNNPTITQTQKGTK